MTSNIRKSNRRRHRKRGGGWFATKKVSALEICDPNKLSSIKDYKEMQSNYMTCCPKSRFGYKNSSPYCNDLDTKFQAAYKSRDDHKDLKKNREKFLTQHNIPFNDDDPKNNDSPEDLADYARFDKELSEPSPRDHGGGGGGAAGEIKKREEIKIEHVRTIDFSSSILVYKNNKRNSTSQ